MLINTRLKSSTELSAYKMLTVCPLLAVTDTVSKALSIAVAFSVTLMLAQLIVALFKKLIPLKLRSLFYVTVTAFCASLTELAVWLVSPAIATALGIYLPLLAVSCIILVRLESTKTENPAGSAIFDSLITSVQMIAVMLVISVVREMFGHGTLFADVNAAGGITVFKNAPIPILSGTVGVLLFTGVCAAAAKLVSKLIKNAKSSSKENA